MLDFFFISDEQPSDFALTQAEFAGGIEYEEFIKAQDLVIIESRFDYYGIFVGRASKCSKSGQC